MNNVDNAITSAIGLQFGNVLYIQDAGLKEKDKVYIDKNTGKLYRCLKNTESQSNTSDAFKLYTIESIFEPYMERWWDEKSSDFDGTLPSEVVAIRTELFRIGKYVLCDISYVPGPENYVYPTTIPKRWCPEYDVIIIGQLILDKKNSVWTVNTASLQLTTEGVIYSRHNYGCDSLSRCIVMWKAKEY